MTLASKDGRPLWETTPPPPPPPAPCSPSPPLLLPPPPSPSSSSAPSSSSPEQALLLLRRRRRRRPPSPAAADRQPDALVPHHRHVLLLVPPRCHQHHHHQYEQQHHHQQQQEQQQHHHHHYYHQQHGLPLLQPGLAARWRRTPRGVTTRRTRLSPPTLFVFLLRTVLVLSAALLVASARAADDDNRLLGQGSAVVLGTTTTTTSVAGTTATTTTTTTTSIARTTTTSITTTATNTATSNTRLRTPSVMNRWIQALINYTYNSKLEEGEACLVTSRSATPLCLDRLSDQGDEGNQCLYLRGKPALDSVCRKNAGKERQSMLGRTLLTFCTHHKLESVVYGTGVEEADYDTCFDLLRDVQHADDTARAIYCEFEHGLSRYDCHNRYSVKWDCTDCKAAYKNWVCTMVLPFFANGQDYLPCRHFCHLVEQQCPYFLPDTKLQYAGESTFLCTDPDIPEELEDTILDSLYADQPNCYLPCHLGKGPRNVPGGIRCHDLSGSSRVTSASSSLLHSPSGVSTNSVSVDCGLRCRWHWPALTLFSVVFGVIGRTFLLPPFCLGLT